jgi:hypothetical protein
MSMLSVRTALRRPSAASRGVAAHLRACGPCGEDFDSLLAAITGTVS